MGKWFETDSERSQRLMFERQREVEFARMQAERQAEAHARERSLRGGTLEQDRMRRAEAQSREQLGMQKRDWNSFLDGRQIEPKSEIQKINDYVHEQFRQIESSFKELFQRVNNLEIEKERKTSLDGKAEEVYSFELRY